MKKNIIGMVFTILALVFIAIGLVGSWYNAHMEISMTMFELESNADIYLTRLEGTSTMGGNVQTQSLSIDEAREQYKAAGMDTGFFDTIGNALILTILALIFAIMALIFSILSVKIPKLQKIGGILAILLFIFALIAPILFMTGFSGYLDEQAAIAEASSPSSNIGDIGFWYSKSMEGLDMSMGPGYAWYLMIIAAVFGLIAAIMLFVKQKQPMPMPSTMQMETPPASPPTQ